MSEGVFRKTCLSKGIMALELASNFSRAFEDAKIEGFKRAHGESVFTDEIVFACLKYILACAVC